MKNSIEDLAIFGGDKLFEKPISCSRLYKPSFDRFIKHSEIFIKNKIYSNNGPINQKLEKKLAIFHNTKYCVTFANGFWALVMLLDALFENSKKRELMLPSMTYRRLADVCSWAKLIPVFVDVDENLSISLSDLKKKVSKNTAGILAVHPIVNCCDVKGLEKFAKLNNLTLVFDSVESVYEEVENGKIGKFGTAEIFSFHASKLFNGFEGGYVTTNSKKLYEKLSLTRAFGFKNKNFIKYPNSLNSKLNEMHASMALSSLEEKAKNIKHNKHIYETYKKVFHNNDFLKLKEFNELKNSYKNIIFELKERTLLSRDELVKILNYENILARAYYSPPLHLKDFRFKVKKSLLTNTELYKDSYIIFPSGAQVSKDAVNKLKKILDFIFFHQSKIKNKLKK